MFIVEFILEILFCTMFGWIGSMVVKAITFGKVELEYGDSSESIISAVIGFGFVLGVFLLVKEFGPSLSGG